MPRVQQTFANVKDTPIYISVRCGLAVLSWSPAIS